VWFNNNNNNIVVGKKKKITEGIIIIILLCLSKGCDAMGRWFSGDYLSKTPKPHHYHTHCTHYFNILIKDYTELVWLVYNAYELYYIIW